MNPVILFFTSTCTAEQKTLARTMGAQFRNPALVDQENPEDCDFVMGEPNDIPECYKDVPEFDEEEYAKILFQLNKSQDYEVPNEEITLEYLESLEKPQLLALSEAKEVSLTKTQKRSVAKIREALAEALIQE